MAEEMALMRRPRKDTDSYRTQAFASDALHTYHDRRAPGLPAGYDVMQKHKLYGFTDVDQTADAAYFIRFLDEACAEPSFQAYKQKSFALLELREGRRILEVGCGAGDDARAMAALVRPGGEVVAVDGSRAMLDEARKRADGCGLPVRFQLGDAQRLDFSNASFDGCRCDRTFMHLDDPRRALAEMARVTRPGGRVVVYEVDFETLVIDAPDRVLARKIVNAWCDGFRDGWLGRRIPALFRETGLLDVETSAETLRLTYPLAVPMVGPPTLERAAAAGVITPSEVEGWLALAARDGRSGPSVLHTDGIPGRGEKGVRSVTQGRGDLAPTNAARGEVSSPPYGGLSLHRFPLLWSMP